MPDYKQRKIQLTPRRYDDGVWTCPYRIIEFRATCWGYHEGTPHGLFASCDAAKAAALDEAKRVVDALEASEHEPQTKSSTVLGKYGAKMRRFFAHPR